MSVSTNTVLVQNSIYEAIRRVVDKNGLNDYDLDNLLRHITQGQVGLETLLLAEDGVLSQDDLTSKIDDAVKGLLKILKVDRGDKFMESITAIIEDIVGLSLELGYIAGNFVLPVPPWSHIVEITGNTSENGFRLDLEDRMVSNIIIRSVHIGKAGEVQICWAK